MYLGDKKKTLIRIRDFTKNLNNINMAGFREFNKICTNFRLIYMYIFFSG